MIDERRTYRSNKQPGVTVMSVSAGKIDLRLFIPIRDADSKFKPEVEGIPDLVLWMSKPGPRGSRQGWGFNITNMTRDELLCFSDAIAAAAQFVEPICDGLDQLAKERIHDDQATNQRHYRSVPSLRFGDGKRCVYINGVREGLDDPLELQWPSTYIAQQIGDDSAELAAPIEGELQSGDSS